MFGNGNTMKIWEVKQSNGKYVDVKFSCSRKGDDGKFVNETSGFCRFAGAGVTNQVLALVPDAARRDVYFDDKDQPKSAAPTIVPSRVGVTTTWNSQTQKQYTNFYVFGFDTANDYFANRNGGNYNNNNNTQKNNGDRVIPMNSQNNPSMLSGSESFMAIPNGIGEELPFN